MTRRPDDLRGLPRTSAVIALGSWVVTVVAVVLRVAAQVPMSPDLLFFAVDATVGMVYGTVGAVILSRRAHPVGWLVSGTGIGGAVAALGGAWGVYQAGRPTLPELPRLAETVSWAWVPGTLALFLVVPWLVRDTPLSVPAWLGAAAGTLVTAALTVQRLVFPMSDSSTTVVAVVGLGLVTAGAVWWRHRRGPAGERPGLGLLALGTALMAASFVPLVLVDAPPDLIYAVPLTHLACQALFPVAFLVTILRNRLWGIDLAVSRASVAGLLTLGLAVVYTIVLVTATALVGSRTAAQVAAAVVVALVVQPVHAWLTGRVRFLVYGDAADPAHAALRLGRQLAASGELLTGLATAVGEALRLESVVVITQAGDEAARWGEPTSGPLVRPLLHGGSVLGDVALTARPGERFDARTRDAIDQLVPVVAAGVALAQGAEELARARDLATRARLAERKVIRRELHDGIGPWLSGLRLGLQGARNVLARDPAAADEILEALQAQVAQRVEDVRQLSRTLLPPVLDQAGLGAALDELAARSAADGFRVTVRGARPDVHRLDPRVAAAAYAIVSESVLNASRHSGAGGCVVTIGVHGPTLTVEVVDEGRGIADDAVAGVGTRSMRERAEELGGRVEVDRPGATGTRVLAELPVDPDARVAVRP